MDVHAVHVYVGPFLAAGVGAVFGSALALLVALVWAAHVGADRALGYGLKEPTGFRDTHLGTL